MREKTVLLVDDELIVSDSLSRDLEMEDFKVTSAACGEEAIAQLKKSHFDFVITDLVIPGPDGFQVLKEAKKKHPRINVIILTGYGDMISAIDALRLGADDFLQKPCDSEELLFRIHNCVTRQELQKKVAPHKSILPICMYCKKIRDDREEEHGHGKWLRMEEYFHNIGIDFSHGYCPECYNKAMIFLDNIPDQSG